ncbi:L,D-transpeptidase [Robiginitalea marina]|nr:L,D-transpeptidase [Robiginitalea marina]
MGLSIKTLLFGVLGTLTGPGYSQACAQVPDVNDGMQKAPIAIEISKPVPIGAYFRFMDSVVARYRLAVPYPLTEHLIVHANPWIIDTLVATDYYQRVARGNFVYDQKELVVLPGGKQLLLPDSSAGERLHKRMKAFGVDVNIPEFRLRVFEDSLELFAFPVRVGQNRTRFLAQSGRETDLRTRPGSGRIIRHERNPAFYNPVDGKRFYSTLRDDGKRTLMPLIPWIETEINGRRNGQMIHPTTNPVTLGKASSNGCIGTSEAAAWVIYYHAPLGTPVRIRYDLVNPNPENGPGRFRDIYGWGRQE